MSADHPNIVKLYECFEDKEDYHLVMEYLEGGDLSNILKKDKKLTEKQSASICY
jgi:serine/threonine protein kinase